MTKISRRRFNFEAAALAATSLSSAAGALGEGLGTQVERAQEATDLGLTAEQAREVDARFSNVIKHYGERLSDEQRQRIRRILVYNEKMLASICAFHVENGDPPASVPKNFDDRSA
jgi:hypothetical protein